MRGNAFEQMDRIKSNTQIMKVILSLMLCMFCIGCFGQNIVHESEMSDTTSAETSTGIMTERIKKAALSYKDRGEVPRFTQFDYAFATDIQEYHKLNTFGVLYISSLNRDKHEYPIKRVYVKTKEGDMELVKVAELTIPVTDEAITSVFGNNRVDYYYLLPYYLTQLKGEVMIDWSTNRTDFSLFKFPNGTKLDFTVAKSEVLPNANKKLDEPALQKFLSREFQILMSKK